jgi:hypothetical protein
MATIYFVLLLLSAVSFFAALWTWRRAEPVRPYPNFIALGLLLWVLVPLIQTAKAM